MDKEVYLKVSDYCAQQERCGSDVMLKLQKLKVQKEDFSLYISKLKEDGFLNEKRYTKTFVEVYTRKKWGKAKIKSALMRKRIPADIIGEYIDDIDQESYLSTMNETAQKKWSSIKGETLRARQTKLIRFLLGKGYEMNLVMNLVKQFND